MKAAMEGLLYSARVDIVFSGHVHAYERFVSRGVLALAICLFLRPPLLECQLTGVISQACRQL